MGVTPIMKPIEEEMNGGGIPIKALVLGPADRVREIFDRMEAAMGTDREAAELRIFSERMKWLHENRAYESHTEIDIGETARLAALGEAAEDAERTESIRGEI
jgi:hypothetical protein